MHVYLHIPHLTSNNPQDVGLIFLSAMATSIAEIGGEVGLTGAEIVGTAMLTLTVATTLVGILTWLVGE